MAFRAFVVGADYHLQFARADAQRIADALKKLGYVLPEPCVPSPDENSDSVAARLKKFITDSKPDDTLLFYFVGHGIPYSRGGLYLALDGYDSTFHPLQTCLSSSEISDAFKDTDVKTKLIILDCCHAGKSFALADFISQDNHAIIAAAEAFEEAFQLKELEACFLSYHLHNALSKDLGKISKDSCLTLNALQEYLQDKVDEHNLSHPKNLNVPNIIAVSKQWERIVLAEIPENMSQEPIYGLQR
ncbi:MAG: caspase family protein, partial [Candidatus Electrothrix sp. ATG1]|nr:caspase family protein [Candidatus Electrothrix sp. ATG1]